VLAEFGLELSGERSSDNFSKTKSLPKCREDPTLRFHGDHGHDAFYPQLCIRSDLRDFLAQIGPTRGCEGELMGVLGIQVISNAANLDHVEYVQLASDESKAVCESKCNICLTGIGTKKCNADVENQKPPQK
jgi:hypothetical protein